MKSRYGDDAKELVRQRANMADVVGRYVSLRQRGRVMVGLCPFHREKTPSFQVNPEMGVYYCFGCGKGGDLFSFVQEIEGVDFREALEMLAETVGVELPRYERREPAGGGAFSEGRTPDEGGGGATKTELLDIHRLAAEFYYECLKGSPRAVDYFKSRGLSAQTVKEFGLGYAPDGWHELLDHLSGKGIPPQRAVECGLAVSRDGSPPYDRFRNRVIFPLCDTGGRVIAFAGRGLDADAQPKYLNSPESALYKKGNMLYGLHKARDGIREHGYVIIVEGYMDYLTLYQAGVRNVVAASGTAFTEEHAHLIKRFASRTTLVFDGDRAGLSAARRAALILAPFGLQVSILALPGDDDPDSFVKREGAEAFSGLLANARPAADFLIDRLVSESDGSPHGKSRVLDELMPYARALSDEVVRGGFLDRLALRLSLDPRLVAKRFADGGNYRPPAGGAQPQASAVRGVTAAMGALEEGFLSILIAAPQLIVTARQYLTPEFLTEPLAENIYSLMLGVYDSVGSLERLFDACGGDPGLRNFVSMIAVKPVRLEHIEDELVQKIDRLRRKYFKARMADIRAELAVCSDEEKKVSLMEFSRRYGEQLKESGLPK
ncbi:MAG: DNA primase [Chitinispirillales bacterium]|jgi:DNA primase|nr:DNA primase [Chitinispirillales bacterium]